MGYGVGWTAMHICYRRRDLQYWTMQGLSCTNPTAIVDHGVNAEEDARSITSLHLLEHESKTVYLISISGLSRYSVTVKM
jgi:hypothetical protein